MNTRSVKNMKEGISPLSLSLSHLLLLGMFLFFEGLSEGVPVMTPLLLRARFIACSQRREFFSQSSKT
jgi:hypothetical protein